jgi:hypothetical protein
MNTYSPRDEAIMARTADRDAFIKTMYTTDCGYCHKPVCNDYDPETGQEYNLGYHWSCIWEDPTGEWEVVTTQNAVTPPRVSVQRYGTHQRAVEVAQDIRRWNRREWNCGAQLDIIVRSTPVCRACGDLVDGTECPASGGDERKHFAS